MSSRKTYECIFTGAFTIHGSRVVFVVAGGGNRTRVENLNIPTAVTVYRVRELVIVVLREKRLAEKLAGKRMRPGAI